MASSKRTGFFWGEDKVTLVEFEKNAPHRVISLPFSGKNGSPSPFSSNFSEEIEITLFFRKLLEENPIGNSLFYISLPIKEIILRSFVIPFAKEEDVKNIVKFEAKKYLPIDIQELTFVFYTIPFVEDKAKHLQVIFFAVRKDCLERYTRIFKQVNIMISYCEPCVVSLAKVLLFKKEISPTVHLAFVVLEKNSGRICFINRGIPQFIREFTFGPQPGQEEAQVPVENLNLRIVNEVANSFDFYTRQFSIDPVGEILISAESVDQELSDALEAELKLKPKKVSPVVAMKDFQSSDMDTIYAMGACVEPPIDPLSEFNFLESNNPKFRFKGGLTGFLKAYKDILCVFLISVATLVGAYVFFQTQLKASQQRYDQLSSRLGIYSNTPMDSVQSELQQDTDKLAAYKSIRVKSDVVFILLKVVGHLPDGALLRELSIKYDQGDTSDARVSISMIGDVFKQDPNEEIKVVHQIFSDFKSDKDLARFIKNVSVSLNLEEAEGRRVVGFIIRCS